MHALITRRIERGQGLGILADAAVAVVELGVAHMGEVGVVDLHEVAAGLPERVKLGVVHLGEPGDQRVLVRVQVLVDAGPAAPCVHVGGRGNADLDRPVCQRPGEPVVLDRQPAIGVTEGPVTSSTGGAYSMSSSS